MVQDDRWRCVVSVVGGNITKSQRRPSTKVCQFPERSFHIPLQVFHNATVKMRVSASSWIADTVMQWQRVREEKPIDIEYLFHHIIISQGACSLNSLSRQSRMGSKRVQEGRELQIGPERILRPRCSYCRQLLSEGSRR